MFWRKETQAREVLGNIVFRTLNRGEINIKLRPKVGLSGCTYPNVISSKASTLVFYLRSTPPTPQPTNSLPINSKKIQFGVHLNF